MRILLKKPESRYKNNNGRYIGHIIINGSIVAEIKPFCCGNDLSPRGKGYMWSILEKDPKNLRKAIKELMSLYIPDGVKFHHNYKLGKNLELYQKQLINLGKIKNGKGKD